MHVTFVAIFIMICVGLDEPLCQKYCSQIYPSYCQFFIYDRTENLCQLFDYPANDFEKSCNKIGGSPFPDLSADCSSQYMILDDSCLVSTSLIHDNTFLLFQWAFCWTLAEFVNDIKFVMNICIKRVFCFQLFTDGYCRFNGSLLENLEEISSIETCKHACQFDEKCKYFIYYKNEKVCETLDNDVYQCDVMKGPPSPSYESCDMGKCVGVWQIPSLIRG